LVYAGTALLILVLIATNAAVILHLRTSEMLDEERQLKNLSLILAEQADRSFQSVDLVISSIADEVAKTGASDAASFDRIMSGRAVNLLLREKLSGLQQLDALVLINRDGKVINFSRSWPVPEIDNSDRDYFRAMTEDPNLKSYISEPEKNHGSGTWSIFLVRRLNGAHGEFIGLILATIRLRYFEDFYRAISPGAGSSIALQRLDGVMLARFPSNDAIGRAFSNSRHLLPDGVSGLVLEPSPIDEKMRIKAAHRLTGYPVLALATKTEDAALASWRGTAWLMTLGAAGCAISIVIAAFAFGRQWKQHAVLAVARAELHRQEDLTAAFEAMRAAKEEAETADRTKSEFLANMSHELRTPLNAVLGFSEVMLSEHFGPLGSDRYRGYARDIHDSGSHLLHIINDVLDLSKAASGKLELVEDWFDVREMIDAVCRLIHPSVEEGKLSLAVHMAPGDLSIYADERMLKQMLLNLLSNACKFTPAAGRIECSVSVDAAGMRFTVADTGIGIPAEDLERVLQPFIQVDSSSTRRHQGTGLGLALVKIMAELHGGTLGLHAAPDRGTIAAVMLPLNRVRPACADVAPGNASYSRTPVRAVV
jgi:signal transduction histidine kinase